MARAWDGRLAMLSLGLSALCSALTWVVVVTTEEGGGAGTRVALWAALLPFAAAVGAFATVSWSRARGEIGALEAVGVSPARAARGAVVSASAVGLMGALLFVSGLADPTHLSPQTAPPPWVVRGGEVSAPGWGVTVAPGQGLTFAPPRAEGAGGDDGAVSPARPLRPVGSLFLALVLAGCALVAPTWACAPRSARRRAVVVVMAVLAFVVANEAARRGVCGAEALLASPAVLLADHWLTRRR